jgi:IMP dehydrogenase
MKIYTSLTLNESGEPPSFDDVMLVPKYSTINSRLDPNIQAIVGCNTTLEMPIISSPMDTVTGSDMAISIGSRGAMGILHRFMSPKEQSEEVMKIIEFNRKSDSEYKAPVVPAVGIGRSERERFKYLYDEYGSLLDWVAIDVANGHSEYMREMIDWVRSVADDSLQILAGNVATGEGFAFLADSGANAIRVGIGGGSICKTRIMTGFGVPTLSSVIDCRKVKESNFNYKNVSIIADGGIKYPADLVKSLAAGADAVIAGRIFAGTLESPGEIVTINNKRMKVYRGMASKEVQDDRKGGLRPGTCAEGVSTYVPLKGKAYYILEEFCGGLRSAMTYANARSITELRENSLFIRLTSSALEESHAFGTKQ